MRVPRVVEIANWNFASGRREINEGGQSCRRSEGNEEVAGNLLVHGRSLTTRMHEDILMVKLIKKRRAGGRSGYRYAVPRKEPQRTTNTAILVRLTTPERQRLEAALERLTDGRPGVRPVLSRFLRDAAMAEADRILGKTK